MRKRLVAAALAACSTLVVAENIPLSSAVPMSDAELDQVTAAAAQNGQNGHLIINSGSHSVFQVRGDDPLSPTHLLCVNCAGSGGPIEGPAMGMHVILNKGHTAGKFHCFGGFTGC